MLPSLAYGPASVGPFFVDESYVVNGTTPDVMVAARFPGDGCIDAFLSFVRAVRIQSPHIAEIKHATWSRARRDGDLAPLASAVAVEVKQAIVVVTDATLVSEQTREWLASLPFPPEQVPGFMERIKDLDLERTSALLDLEWMVPGFHVPQPERMKRHTRRLLHTRANAALYRLLDHELIAHRVRTLPTGAARFIDFGALTRECAMDALEECRVFDEGNRPTVDHLRHVCDLAHGAIVAAQTWMDRPSRRPGYTIEAASTANPFMQAADIAAGVASDLYQESGGAKRLADYFRCVVINGRLQR